MTDKVIPLFRLSIRLNNCATNDPCAICRQRTDPIVGPELFLAGTWSLVCHECGRLHDPRLMLHLWAQQRLAGAIEY